VERAVSAAAAVFDMPSVNASGPIRAFSKKGPLGVPVSGGAGNGTTG
jgi:hypothetical protein